MKLSIETIERQPWVFIFEAVFPTVTYPISNIIDMLCGMEFNAKEILGSL